MARKILLIEDEEKIARFTELELVHEGYEVTKAFNGRDGLELAEKGGFGSPYHLLRAAVAVKGKRGVHMIVKHGQLPPRIGEMQLVTLPSYGFPPQSSSRSVRRLPQLQYKNPAFSTEYG